MSDFYTEKNETPEQRRFRIFAMTHKEPSKAADEWIKDKERIAALEEAIRLVISKGGLRTEQPRGGGYYEVWEMPYSIAKELNTLVPPAPQKEQVE